MATKKHSFVRGIIAQAKAHPGLVQFLWRGALALVFLFVLQFLSLPLVDGVPIPQELYTVQYIALGGVLMFSIVILILLVKDHLKEFPKKRFSFLSLAAFGALGLLFHFLFFYAKIWISDNPFLALENSFLVMGFRYLMLAGSLLSFAIAFLGLSWVKDFVSKFKTQLGATSLFFAVFTFFSYAVQNSWQFMSFAITRTQFYLLSPFFENVRIYDNDTLGIGNFVVNIGKVCSGIESILLFTVMYSLIFFLDRKKLNIKRMLLLIIPGIMGVFLVNNIRIALILILGKLINPQFAVGIFHTNAGWVLFIAYFFVFWYVAYPWVRLDAKKSH